MASIEQHHRRNDRHPSRNRQIVEQAPAPPFPGQRQTHSRGGKQDPRRTPVFSATMARLLGQRLNLEYDLGRRGAAASHSAIAAKMVINAPSRMAVS